MASLSDVMNMTFKLENAIAGQFSAGADLSKTVISVSCPEFMILYVPKGCEQNAKMELNG